MNACGGFATIAHSAHDKIRTANKIATGKHREHWSFDFRRRYAAPFVDSILSELPAAKIGTGSNP
jgi:hypothetical protein